MRLLGFSEIMNGFTGKRKLKVSRASFKVENNSQTGKKK